MIDRHLYEGKNLDITVKRLGDKAVAYMRCFYDTQKSQVEVTGFDFDDEHKDKGIGEFFLREIDRFAAFKGARTIVAYAEPKEIEENRKKHRNRPKEGSIRWYESHGYVHENDVCGVVPCMVKIV